MENPFDTILTDDGLIETSVVQNAIIDLDHAIANTKTVTELSEGTLRPILVDISKISSITKEARDHFSMKNREPKVTAIALIISSPVSTMVGNFFINLSNPMVPTKLFTKKDKAREWLKKFR